MDRTDIYEHLANIYLDSSKKKKAKSKKNLRYKIIFVVTAFIFAIFSLSVINLSHRKTSINDEFAFVIQPDAVKINYNFNSIKKEVYSIDLNHLNLARFKALGFSVRKTDANDIVYLRVELISAFNEVSEVYIKDIRSRWKSFKVAFADFKKISEWSDMARISFIVEEWNTKNKHGIVYIDEIKFIR